MSFRTFDSLGHIVIELKCCFRMFKVGLQKGETILNSLKCCKKILGVISSTPNDIVFGELRVLDMYSRRTFRIISSWLNIIMTPDCKLRRLIL